MAEMKTSNVFVVILAGGHSSRLFPFNKVLSDLTGSGKSLLQQAYERVSVVPRRQIYVLTVRDMVPPVRRQLSLAADHCFVDPVRRGTWPAMLWAMAHLRRKNADAMIAVVTGDHVIPKVKEFQKAFGQAVRAAAREPVFVVIPVQPSRDPKEWTGFGAIQADAEVRRRTDPAKPIIGFEEKPSLERAGQMIEEGGWFWNAGMFFFRIAVAEAALQAYQPAMHRIYIRMSDALFQGKAKLASRIFESFPEKISHPLDFQRFVDNTIDYSIMMPMVHQPKPGVSAWVTRQALSSWTDLGQWTALRQVVKSDRERNTRIGRVGEPVDHRLYSGRREGLFHSSGGTPEFCRGFFRERGARASGEGRSPHQGTRAPGWRSRPEDRHSWNSRKPCPCPRPAFGCLVDRRFIR